MKFIQGDCLERLQELEDNSIDCVVTSPPYWGLRDYNISKQIGLEPKLDDHIKVIVKVFRKLKRVLKKEGTVWLNYGDCYATAKNGRDASNIRGDDRTFRNKPFTTIQGILKNKDLCLLPARIAIALQEDGWYIRSEIIWHKPNPMPESVRDRPTSAHEKIWLITKSPKYYYDYEAIKEPFSNGTYLRYHNQKNILKYQQGSLVAHAGKKTNGPMKPVISGNKRNKRNVWTVTTKPFKEAHFATFPKDLIEPCIKAGCPEKVCVECGKPQVKEFYRDKSTLPVKRNKRDGDSDRAVGGVYQKWMEENPVQITIKPSCDCNKGFKPGVVLDPFAGAGTVGLVCKKLNRNAILIELNPDYIEIAKNRINENYNTVQTSTTAELFT